MKRFLQIFRDGNAEMSSLQVPLADGEQGNAETLRAMAAIVNHDRLQPDLRAFVLDKVIGNTRGHDARGEVQKIFDFAQKQITYRQDPIGVERVADVWSIIYAPAFNPGTGPTGDCGIKSIFIASCCAMFGYKPFFVVAKQRANQRAFNHVYNMVLVDGQYIYLDATPEDRPAGWHLTDAYETGVFQIF